MIRKICRTVIATCQTGPWNVSAMGARRPVLGSAHEHPATLRHYSRRPADRVGQVEIGDRGRECLPVELAGSPDFAPGGGLDAVDGVEPRRQLRHPGADLADRVQWHLVV